MLPIAIHSKALATLLVYPGLPALLLVLCGSLVYLYIHGSDKRLDRLLAVTALILPLHATAMCAARWASCLRPQKLDLYVYRIDGWAGFQPSFALGRLVDGRIPLMLPLALSYQLLPFAILAIFGVWLWREPMREAMALMRVFVLNLVLSVPLYLLFPVCGPGYAFPGYPAPPEQPVIPHPIALDAAPNGVPSVHFSTALLICWYSRKLPLGRWIAALYLLLTAGATLSSGEHYLFDLLAAIPYAALIYQLGKTRPQPAPASALVSQEAQ